MSFIIPGFRDADRNSAIFLKARAIRTLLLRVLTELIRRAQELKANAIPTMLAGGKDVGHHENYLMRWPMRLVQDSIDSRCRYLFPRLMQPLEGIGSHESCRVG